MSRGAAALAILLAACSSTDNRAILDELQSAAGQSPDAELDARVRSPGPFRPVAGSAHGAEVPMTLPMLAGKVPIVEGRINGVEMPFLLDTGTTHVVLSAEGARASSLYLPPGLTVQLVAPGYRSRYRVGAPASLSIGNSTLAGGVVAVPERRSDIARRLGVRNVRHATIGGSVLSNFRVTLDFGTREVRLEPHGGEPVAGVMWTEVEINGKRCLMLVDSGASGVFLEPAFAESLGLIDGAEKERHSDKAETPGDARMSTVRIDSLVLGPHAFTDLRAHVVRVTEEGDAPGGIPRGGLLGLPGLGRHRWIIDYAKQRLILDEVR